MEMRVNTNLQDDLFSGGKTSRIDVSIFVFCDWFCSSGIVVRICTFMGFQLPVNLC